MLFPDDPEFTEAEAQRELSPFHDVLRDAVMHCHDILRSLAEGNALVAKGFEYLSARQHLMNSLVVERMKELAAEGSLGNVEVLTERRFLELRFDSIDLRCKKVSPDGSTSNYPTKSSIDYKNQIPFPDGPAFVYRARLTLGWLWGPTAIDIEDIRIIYAKGDMTQWQYSILKPADESDAGLRLRPTGSGGGHGGTKFGDDEDRGVEGA
ncbi:MAG: hypothetical protein H6819_00445 [Phycisphaerales bacterium]|nr:hypothetical protein [Phycisphaerales bacterium]MCB9857322.1 hypothetical protein [Phycisphaerales bacterium]MCB9862964.1 hypothetical protein [Phycisphaerales bacterium]